MKTITSLRRKASVLSVLLPKYANLAHSKNWDRLVAAPMREFGTELRAALHEGTVGQHEQFWQRVVNNVIERIASEEDIVRRIAGHETLFAQVKDLVAEVFEFPTVPLVAKYNRYQIVLAFCEAMKICTPH